MLDTSSHLWYTINVWYTLTCLIHPKTLNSPSHLWYTINVWYTLTGQIHPKKLNSPLHVWYIIKCLKQPQLLLTVARISLLGNVPFNCSWTLNPDWEMEQRNPRGFTQSKPFYFWELDWTINTLKCCLVFPHTRSNNSRACYDTLEMTMTS